MSVDNKNKKKKPQVLETKTETETQPQEKENEVTSAVADSTESINKEVIKILKKGEVKLRHAIIVSDEKLTKTLKEIVKATAEDMEKAGYPVEKICYVIKRLWCPKHLVGERTVEDALDEKYKDPEQSRVAKMGGIHGGRRPRAQQSKPKNSQVLRQQIKDQTKEIDGLKKTIKDLKETQRRNCESMINFWVEISDPKIPDKEIVERIKNNAKPTIDFLKSFKKQLDLDLGLEQ